MSTEVTPQTAPGTERPDVDALMERVRAGVADKLARGFYTAEEVELVRLMELSVKERKDFGPDLDEGIAFINSHWDPMDSHPITSHRGGAVGRLLVGSKTIVRKLTRPVASLALMRQTEFNGAVTRLLTSALHGLSTLQLRFDELQLKYYDLAKRHQELAGRLEAAERPAPPVPAPPRETASHATPALEELQRGPQEVLTERRRGQLRHFRGAPGRVLDAGSGRGELLRLLREAGVPAYGVEPDARIAARCREQGFEVVAGDPLEHLAGLAAGTLGGIFAGQVVEHLATPQLLAFVRLAHEKLAPGGRFVVETLNPASLGTFSGPLYRDLAPTRPVHPEALRMLVEGLGFRDVAVEFASPFPPEAKLREIGGPPGEAELVRALNENFARLNALLYGNQVYAVTATR
jgi:O-antigen chain-terminating methyltransferase